MHPIPPSQLVDALRWRYSTKVFDPSRRLPPEVWTALEEALILTPSSYGLQPYQFLVIQDGNTRERLLAHSFRQKQVVDCSHLVVFAARTSLDTSHLDRWVTRLASVRGVPPASLRSYREMMRASLLDDAGGLIPAHWAALQAYIALGGLLTAAALLGVDACPMEGFEAEGYNRVLGLEASGHTSVVACALGYRSGSDKYAAYPKARFEKADLIRRI